MNKMKKIIWSCAVIAALILVIGGAFILFNNKKQPDEHVIRMAVPAMSASAPFFVIAELNLMDKYLPNSQLELIITESGNAMNEALIANQIDGMITGLTNFLIGKYRNVPYRIFTSVLCGRFSIQTNDPDIKSIHDVKNNHLIGINGTTGMHALLLSLTAEKFFGGFDALNDQIVVMRSDDITLALANNAGISLAFSDITSRVIQNELGNPTILEDTEFFDGRVFTHYVIFSEVFYAENHELINAFYSALEEAVNLISSKDDVALNIISEKFEIGKDTFAEFLDLGFIIFELDNFDSIDILTDMVVKTGLIPDRKPLEEMIFDKRQD
jgi:ABC-type nitrate/sulfonate/bicarbonate transport system substrate-binding protein